MSMGIAYWWSQCSVDGCNRPGNVGHGFCAPHLWEHRERMEPRRRYGAPSDEVVARVARAYHLRGDGSVLDAMRRSKFDGSRATFYKYVRMAEERGLNVGMSADVWPEVEGA